MIDPALQVFLWLFAALFIVLGFAGLVLPVLPGIPLIFGGLVLLAWAENFAYVGWVTLTLLGVLALLSYAIDFLASALGAKRFGASSRAVVGAALPLGFTPAYGLDFGREVARTEQQVEACAQLGRQPVADDQQVGVALGGEVAAADRAEDDRAPAVEAQSGDVVARPCEPLGAVARVAQARDHSHSPARPSAQASSRCAQAIAAAASAAV